MSCSNGPEHMAWKRNIIYTVKLVNYFPWEYTTITIHLSTFIEIVDFSLISLFFYTFYTQSYIWATGEDYQNYLTISHHIYADQIWNAFWEWVFIWKYSIIWSSYKIIPEGSLIVLIVFIDLKNLLYHKFL